MLCIKANTLLYLYVRTLYHNKFYILSFCLLTFDIPNLAGILFLSVTLSHQLDTNSSQLEKL